jgi:hypothetical protein
MSKKCTIIKDQSSSLNKNLEHLSKRLDDILRHPLRLKGEYERPINMLTEQVMEEEPFRAYNPLSKVQRNFFGWFPANPNKKDTVDRSKRLYVECIHPPKNSANKTYINIPTNTLYSNDIKYEIDKLIEDAIRSSEWKNIIVQGDRGAGKTAFFNYWLNNQTKKLEDNKILWFRVDVSKIYKLWIEQSNESKFNYNFSILDYHKAHTVYVICKYCNENLPEKILASDALTKIWTGVKRRALSMYELNGIFENDLSNFIKNKDEFFNPDNTENYIRLINEDINKFERVKTLYNLCTKEIKDLGYTVLIFIDGLDNIPLEPKNRLFYEAMIKDAAKIFYSDYKSAFGLPVCALILAVRPETARHLHNSGTSYHKNKMEEHVPSYWYIAPCCPNNLLKHKTSVVDKPNCKALSEYKENIENYFRESTIGEFRLFNREEKNRIIISNSGDFKRFANTYVNNLITAISVRYKIAEKIISQLPGNIIKLNFSSDKIRTNSTTFIRDIMNNNMRVFSDNFLSIFDAINFMNYTKVSDAKNINRYLEYMLLNGYDFLNSPKTQSKTLRGHVLPNLFYWDKSYKNNNNRWMGLLNLRILQLLNINCEEEEQFAGKTQYKYLINFLHNLFEYPKDLIENQLTYLIGFGLVKYSDSDIGLQKGNSLSKEFFHFGELQITNKGRFILDFIFIYPEWLYFCALDTHLLRVHVNYRKYYSMHKPPIELDRENIKDELKSNFHASFIPTTIMLVRHILSQQTLDDTLINNNINKLLQSHNIDIGSLEQLTKDDFVAAFSIPVIFIIMAKNNLSRRLKNLRNKYEATADDVFKNLIDIYN